MPRVIDLSAEVEAEGCTLEACIVALDRNGFDPRDEDSLLHAARWLRRLGANRDFLAERLLAELARRGFLPSRQRLAFAR
jgi:hypothetical protein